MMRLVDDDKIGERHGHGARPDRTRVQRLDRGDLRSSQRPQFLFVTGLDDAMSHAGGGELVGSLLDDLAAMGNHQRTSRRCRDDGAGDDGLAGAGRGDHDHAALALRNEALEFGGDVSLIRPQDGAHVRSFPAMASSAAPSGDAARSWLSRSKAWRITSTGTPCCNAIEHTTAASLIPGSTPRIGEEPLSASGWNRT